MAALLDWLQFLAGLCAAGNLQLEYGAVPGIARLPVQCIHICFEGSVIKQNPFHQFQGAGMRCIKIRTVWTAIPAALVTGKAYTPVEMEGKAIRRIPCSTASRREFR